MPEKKVVFNATYEFDSTRGENGAKGSGILNDYPSMVEALEKLLAIARDNPDMTMVTVAAHEVPA